MFVVIATSLLVVFGLSEAAWANGTWSWNEYSPCSKTWTTNSYGGYFVAHAQYTADTDQTDRATITNSEARAYGFADCGPAGRALTADKVKVTAEYWLYATG